MNSTAQFAGTAAAIAVFDVRMKLVEDGDRDVGHT
jgi:hypothetical protein